VPIAVNSEQHNCSVMSIKRIDIKSRVRTTHIGALPLRIVSIACTKCCFLLGADECFRIVTAYTVKQAVPSNRKWRISTPITRKPSNRFSRNFNLELSPEEHPVCKIIYECVNVGGLGEHPVCHCRFISSPFFDSLSSRPGCISGRICTKIGV